jgi:hypothetical protein
VAWILHLSATDPLLTTYSPKRSRPRFRRLALETDHIPAKFFDPIRYRRRHKNACTYSGTFSGAGLSPYKTRRSISARKKARERLAATRRKSTRHLPRVLLFHRSADRSVGNQSDCRRGQRRYFAREHEARDGRPSRVGAGATCESYKRLRHILQIIDNIFAVLDAPFRYPLRNITLEVGVKFVREVVID